MDADTQIVTSFNDYPELQVVFDFFADNPQKVLPSAAVMDHSRSSAEDGNHAVPRQDPYWESIRIMQTSDLFMEGMLLKSVDCKRERTLHHHCRMFSYRRHHNRRRKVYVLGSSVRPSVHYLPVNTQCWRKH